MRRTTARRPPFAPAFLEHGGQLARIGRFDEANAVLESGLAFAPDSVELRMELGFLHLKRNNRAKARAMLSEESDPAELSEASGIGDQDGLDEQIPFRDWSMVGMV